MLWYLIITLLLLICSYLLHLKIPAETIFTIFSSVIVESRTVNRFVWVSAKFGTCTVVSVNGTLVEDKMRWFKDECAYFSCNKCLDGASAKFSTDSQETDNSAASRASPFFLWLLRPEEKIPQKVPGRKYTSKISKKPKRQKKCRTLVGWAGGGGLKPYFMVRAVYIVSTL